MRMKGQTRRSRGKPVGDEVEVAEGEAPPQRAPKSLDKAVDAADRLAYLSEKYRATYSRTNADGKVRIVLHVTGEGATNDEAIANLISQLGAE